MDEGGGSASIDARIRTKYAQVATRAEGHFPYPVGRASAERLGYEPEWIEAVPAEVVGRFVGVGNPFRVRTPRRGERVLDVGCGCGFDSFVASHLVGAGGEVVGVDLCEEMLDVARRGLTERAALALRFELASATALPFRDAHFDQVISNGVLNLVPDKPAAFREIARVLRPGGVLASADLVVVEDVPKEVLDDPAAWET